MARTIEVVILGKDKLSGALGSAGSGLSKFGKVAVATGAIAAAALVGVGVAVAKLALDAAQLEPTRVTFDNLTASIGSTADAMLKKLRPATMGIVSDADLMRAANKLLAMGLAETEDEAAKLSKMATTLGMAMGEDATASMENFALMMANQSIPRLDSFGISSSKVRVRIQELQEATFDMSREEAFKIAVMEQGAAAMEKVGDISETGAVKMAQFRTTITNLKDSIGKALLPVFHAFMDKVLTPLAKQLEKIVPKVENLIGVFADLANEVFGADMGRAIDFLKNEVWEVLEDIFGREIANKIVGFGVKVLGWIDVFRTEVIPVLQGILTDIVLPALRTAIAFVVEHWQIFAKVGAVVGAVILAISHPIVLLIAGIAALLLAWTTNWGGIQDKTRAAWAFIQEKTRVAWAFMQRIFERIAGAINWIREKILPPLQEAFRKVWSFITEVVRAAWEGFKPHIEEIKVALREFWTEFKPRLEEAWDAIKEAMKKVADWVVDTLIPALRDLWDALEPVREKIVELAGRFGDFMGSAFVTGLIEFLEANIRLWDILLVVLGKIWDILGLIADKLGSAFGALRDWEPPWWFRWFLPGSMSPIEQGLRGAADAFREMSPMLGGVAGMGTMSLMAGGVATIRVEGLGPGLAEELEEKIARRVLDLLIPGRA